MVLKVAKGALCSCSSSSSSSSVDTALTTCVLQQELELLAEDAAVYKLVGPVLIKQDQFEAKSNVQKRLDFISGEMNSLDSQLKSLDEKRQRKQQQVCHTASQLCLLLLSICS